jgi:hypothetical protein
MPDDWSHEETDAPLYADQPRCGAEQLNLLRRATLRAPEGIEKE